MKKLNQATSVSIQVSPQKILSVKPQPSICYYYLKITNWIKFTSLNLKLIMSISNQQSLERKNNFPLLLITDTKISLNKDMDIPNTCHPKNY